MFAGLRQLLSAVARMKTIRLGCENSLTGWDSDSTMTATVNKGEVLSYKEHINSSTNVKLTIQAYFLCSYARPYFLSFSSRPSKRFPCSMFLT